MTGIHDDVETYEPKVNMGYENSIPKIDNSFDDITDENGNINIIINSEVIGQTLAKKIYTSWISGLRELYNNEARACRMANKQGADSSIVITINPNKTSREISIQGVDSLGITKAMFNKVLRVIGTSGNVDGEEIGQFGMGFISYALLTDAVLLETWSRETEEHYAMLCDSGLKFKPIPIDTTNNVNTMSEYGTKLTMTCNEDVDFSTMIYNIKKLARFSKVSTKIILLDNIEGRHSYYNTDHSNDSYDKGIIDCESFDNGMVWLKNDPTFINRYSTSGRDKQDKVLFYKEITIDNEDYRFDGLMIVQKSAYGTIRLQDNKRHCQTYLAGTKVDSDVSVDGMYNAIINIKNERKYPPSASRDSLTNNAKYELEQQLKQDMKEIISEYNIDDIDEYKKSINKCLYSKGVVNCIDDYFNEPTKNISDTLNSRYATVDKTTITLTDLLASGGTLVALKSLRGDLMEALDKYIDGTVTFFRIPTKLSDEERGHRLDLFKQLDVILGEQYKKDHKIKEKRGKTTTTTSSGTKISFSEDRTIVLYNSNRGYRSHIWGYSSGWRAGSEKYSTTIGEVNENKHDRIVRVNSKQFADVCFNNNFYENDWKVVHDMKGLSEDIITFEALMIKVANTEYQTPNGLVKGKDLRGEYNIIYAQEPHLLDGVLLKELPEPIIYLAVPSVEAMIELYWYEQMIDKNEKFSLKMDKDAGELSNSILTNNSKFSSNEYTELADRILHLYWIEQKLPANLAKVFSLAMQHSQTDVDEIEQTARELDLELNK